MNTESITLMIHTTEGTKGLLSLSPWLVVLPPREQRSAAAKKSWSASMFV